MKEKLTVGLGGFFTSLIPHPSSLILLAAALLLASCGFQLRGTAQLPFSSLYVQAPPASQVATQLKRAVRTGRDRKSVV